MSNTKFELDPDEIANAAREFHRMRKVILYSVAVFLALGALLALLNWLIRPISEGTFLFLAIPLVVVAVGSMLLCGFTRLELCVFSCPRCRKTFMGGPFLESSCQRCGFYLKKPKDFQLPEKDDTSPSRSTS